MPWADVKKLVKRTCVWYLFIAHGEHCVCGSYIVQKKLNKLHQITSNKQTYYISLNFWYLWISAASLGAGFIKGGVSLWKLSSDMAKLL